MKKVLVFIFVFLFTHNAYALTFTVDTESSTTKETTSSHISETQKDDTTSFIPAFIRTSFDTFSNFTETLRLEWKASISDKQVELKARIEAEQKEIDKDLKTREDADPETYKKTTYVDSTHGNALHRALLQILLFLYTAIIFILTNAFVFYGIIVLAVILIVRFIWNHFL